MPRPESQPPCPVSHTKKQIARFLSGAARVGTAITVATLSACAHLASPPPAPPRAALPVVSVALPTPAPQAEPSAAVLAFADKLRALPAPELAAEVATLGNSSEPAEQLKLALALHQQHQVSNLRPSAELARAQELVAQVLAADTVSAKALHPLARLLAARYADQRRWDEQAERQSQQLRDLQRRLDQTTERLEALKAIERSLSNRPTSPHPSNKP